LGFDCDNGSEFLNHHLLNYLTDRPKKRRIQFTRSRPYHKNDQRTPAARPELQT
jgi:hypothetical protein